MKYLSICSGIEAATQAWHPLGWEPVAFSEIEPFPCAVLKHHYPDVPNWGDMTKFKEWPDADVDVLAGGTPCQSFSVAGLRGGLADPRGNLALTYLAIAAKYRPSWLVWENVPGVLSSLSHDAPDPCPPTIDLDGDDGPDDGTEVVVTDEYDADENHALWCFMAGAAELGYHGGFRALDAQFTRTRRFPWAIPQRRRRVFFVGYLGDWRRAAAVLFDRESLSGHPAPRREAGQRPSPTISARPSGGGGIGTDFDCDGGLIHTADVAPTLNAHFGDKLGLENQHINEGGGCSFAPEVANSLTARMGKGINTTLDEGQTPIVNGGVFDVAHTLKADGFDASEDGTGRGTPIVPIAFDCKGSEVQVETDGSHPPLRSMGHLNTHQNAGGHAAITIMEAVGFDMRGRDGGAMPEGPHDTASIRAASGGSSRTYVAQPWAVRRLTPRECERLMGFPDDFTLIPYRGNPAQKCPDGPRYKALGNSWAINVAEWIGERIAMVEAMK